MLEAFDPADYRPIVTDLTDIAALSAQDEENLDPASQTGDFVLPDQVLPLIEVLTHLEMLVYHYADGRELEVYHPVSLSVRFDGAEQITCKDRVGITAPPGYLKRESFPKFGQACFAGHAPINHLGD